MLGTYGENAPPRQLKIRVRLCSRVCGIATSVPEILDSGRYQRHKVTWSWLWFLTCRIVHPFGLALFEEDTALVFEGVAVSHRAAPRPIIGLLSFIEHLAHCCTDSPINVHLFTIQGL